MVDSELLARASRRLQQLLSCSDPFGGLPTVLAGDPMQLKPPSAPFVFEPPKPSARAPDSSAAALTGHALYMDTKLCIMLKQPVRAAADPVYAEFLELFRLGVFSEADRELIRRRFIATNADAIAQWSGELTARRDAAPEGDLLVLSAWASNAARHEATREVLAQLQADEPSLRIVRIAANVERSSARATSVTRADATSMLSMGDHRFEPIVAPCSTCLSACRRRARATSRCIWVSRTARSAGCATLCSRPTHRRCRP
jgi:hypothetical protein